MLSAHLSRTGVRPRSGDGLTHQEALRACKRHGFTPQTVGAWVRGAHREIRNDDLRYLGDEGRRQIEKHGVMVTNR